MGNRLLHLRSTLNVSSLNVTQLSALCEAETKHCNVDSQSVSPSVTQLVI